MFFDHEKGGNCFCGKELKTFKEKSDGWCEACLKEFYEEIGKPYEDIYEDYHE